MKASEARKLTQDSYAKFSDKDEVEYKRICGHISNVAKRGESKLYLDSISQAVINRLQADGFSVENGSDRNLTYALIKW
ncbi:hypothetical protein AB6805_30405 [Chitinophaga sp. RCC_12]|uniref:hypothetical protein n=1 Tax=Chitinophaga sp. RCC_12 TaxID=3239226 RepID=UPI00352492E9